MYSPITRFPTLMTIFSTTVVLCLIVQNANAEVDGPSLIKAEAALISARAQFLQATAEWHFKRAQTAEKWQDVHTKKLDNKQKVAEVFYAKREMHRKYRESKQRNRMTHERAVKLAQKPQPPRFVDLVGVAGPGIPWPDVFHGSDFNDTRSQIDDLWIAPTTLVSSPSTRNSSQIKRMAQQMRTLLKNKIHQLPSNDFVLASRFLKSLAYEAELRDAQGVDRFAVR